MQSVYFVHVFVCYFCCFIYVFSEITWLQNFMLEQWTIAHRSSLPRTFCPIVLLHIRIKPHYTMFWYRFNLVFCISFCRITCPKISFTPKTVFILKQHQSTDVPKSAKLTLQLLNYIIINLNHLHTTIFYKSKKKK